MIHGNFAAVSFRMPLHHHNPVLPQGGKPAETSSPDRTVPPGLAALGQENREANPSYKAHRLDGLDHSHKTGGHQENIRQRFNDAVGAAVFAHRMRMEMHAEIKGIRTEIRGLMGEVGGGQLTSQQQDIFDKLVGRIAELRDINSSRHRPPADAGIAMQAPEDTRMFTVFRQHLLDRQA